MKLADDVKLQKVKRQMASILTSFTDIYSVRL